MTDSRFSACLWVLLIALLLTGYFLRASRLDEFPPGLSQDEADNLVDGAFLGRSGRLPFYQDHQRPEPLVRLYGAATSRFFGDTIWAFRYTSVLWGMLSLAAVFWASQQCFAEQPWRVRRLIGLVALACLAVALGHIALNRSLYRAVPLVIFLALATGFTCRALRRTGLRDFVLAGIALALGCYTYTAGLVVPLAYLPLVIQLALFRRDRWRVWLPGLAATALTLLFLTLPIGYLLLTQPEAILSRASDVLVADPLDWRDRIDKMAAYFLTRGDINPQYNVAGAALVPPEYAPFFLAGIAALLLQPRRPASTLILSLLVVCTLPALLTSITNGLRIHLVFALIPLVAGASVILPFRLLGRFRGLSRPLSLACLAVIAALAVHAANESRRVYAHYWETAGSHWQKWRIHDLRLSHSEWFFRTDKKHLADWIAAREAPLLLPFSELNYPTLRALLMRDYPNVASMSADFALPPETRIVAPWSLESKAFVDQTTRLALLNDETITVLPPLIGDEKRLVFSNRDQALELTMPDSNIPAVARVQALPPNWSPKYVSSAGDMPLARFNAELELRGYRGPDVIDAPGDFAFVLEWSVARPVSHEYGAYLQLLTPEWTAIAGERKHIWRWLYPTVVWPPGEIHSQIFSLRLDEELPPGAYRLVAGAWYTNGPELLAESVAGRAINGLATIGWVKVAQDGEAAISPDALPLSIKFGGQFMLSHIAVDRENSDLIVDLYWTALQDRPSIDATIFLHALDAQGAIAAQSDVRPWQGRYPTFIWDAGEIVVTSHRLQVASIEDLELVGGMYTQPDAKRLIARFQGERILNDIVLLGEVRELLARQAP